MSKRKREEGPTLVNSFHRPSQVPTYSQNVRESVLGKRVLFEMPELVNKRPRALESPWEPCYEPQKRSAEFDIEIDRLRKRLKATVPSAAEAIAFLLPHMYEMRRLYLQEQGQHLALQAKNTELLRSNALLTATLRDQLTQKNAIQRQLNLARYRLTMASPQVLDSGSF